MLLSKLIKSIDWKMLIWRMFYLKFFIEYHAKLMVCKKGPNKKIYLRKMDGSFFMTLRSRRLDLRQGATPSSFRYARSRRCCIRPMNLFTSFSRVPFLDPRSPRFFLHPCVRSLHFIAQGPHRLHQSTRRADSVARRLPTNAPYNYGESQSRHGVCVL